MENHCHPIFQTGAALCNEVPQLFHPRIHAQFTSLFPSNQSCAGSDRKARGRHHALHVPLFWPLGRPLAGRQHGRVGPAKEIHHRCVGFPPGAPAGRERAGVCPARDTGYVCLSFTWAAKAAGADFSVGMSLSLYPSFDIFIIVDPGLRSRVWKRQGKTTL